MTGACEWTFRTNSKSCESDWKWKHTKECNQEKHHVVDDGDDDLLYTSLDLEPLSPASQVSASIGMAFVQTVAATKTWFDSINRLSISINTRSHQSNSIIADALFINISRMGQPNWVTTRVSVVKVPHLLATHSSFYFYSMSYHRMEKNVFHFPPTKFSPIIQYQRRLSWKITGKRCSFHRRKALGRSSQNR